MPQTDRDRRIVEHLATRVCGLAVYSALDWHAAGAPGGCLVRVEPHGALHISYHRSIADVWNPLADTTLGKGQAVEVWEWARKMGIAVSLIGQVDLRWVASANNLVSQARSGTVFAASAARALCEAIYRATGGSEECVQISDKEEA